MLANSIKIIVPLAVGWSIAYQNWNEKKSIKDTDILV